MAWTAPITAVTGSVFPSAVYNQVVRDNLLQTMPALTTTTGSFFATVGTNQIAERIPQAAYIGGVSTTTSTSYTDLASGPGPAVTCQTGTMAAVFIYCNQYNSTATNACWMSFDVSGATTQAVTDNFAVQLQLQAGQHAGAGFLLDNLTPGLNTFTARFRVSAGTGQFSSRRLAIWPF
jgi:3-deoxy-D-arabino-heptulosonate 7-phosphate (DAHP) synthase